MPRLEQVPSRNRPHKVSPASQIALDTEELSDYATTIRGLLHQPEVGARRQHCGGVSVAAVAAVLVVVVVVEYDRAGGGAAQTGRGRASRAAAPRDGHPSARRRLSLGT